MHSGSHPRAWRAVAGLALAGSAAYALYRAHQAFRERPLSKARWQEFVQSSDQSLDFPALLRLVSQKGLAPDVRKHAWLYLLDVFQPYMTAGEKSAASAALRQDYISLLHKARVMEDEASQAVPSRRGNSPVADNGQKPQGGVGSAEYGKSLSIILMDAVRTAYPLALCLADGESEQDLDSSPEVRAKLEASNLNKEDRRAARKLANLLCAYAVHNPDIGYCQGMSDIALPFLLVFQSEPLAFACFKQMMRSARQNFLRDGSGIERQLKQISEIVAQSDPVLVRHLESIECAHCFFAHRMLLVLLRRDLSSEESMRAWEMTWASDRLKDLDVKSSNRGNRKGGEGVKTQPSLLIFLIAAAITRQRNSLLSAQNMDDILRVFIGQKLSLRPLLRPATRMRNTLRVDESDRA